MKKFFSIMAASMLASSMFAAVVTLTPDDFLMQGTTGVGSNVTATVNGVTFTCDKGYGKDTTRNAKGSYVNITLRCYRGAKINIASTETINNINFTFDSYTNSSTGVTTTYTGGLEASYSDVNATEWNVNINGVDTLTSQARFTRIVVYTGSDKPSAINDGDTLTCAEATEAAKGGSSNTVFIEGYVTYIQEVYSSSYGNMTFWMDDAKGSTKTFEAFRVICDEEDAPRVNDHVRVYGKLYWYEKNSVPETEQGGSVEIIDRDSTAVPVPSGVLTCAQAKEYGLQNAYGTATVRGYVTYAYKWDSTHNDISFWMDDVQGEVKTVEAYYATPASGSVQPKVGDLVECVGPLSPFTQTDGTVIVEINKPTYTIISGTPIETVKDDAKAVKFVENGQIVIRKNGVKYNVFGAAIE